MTEIRHIRVATKADAADVSINLDNQRVYGSRSKGLSKRVNRTINLTTGIIIRISETSSIEFQVRFHIRPQLTVMQKPHGSRTQKRVVKVIESIEIDPCIFWTHLCISNLP